ncbi:hypothetical protein BGZ60DRAFT_532383 [Tricladium varicosporioides]|nr:hypothetical protein BGZ60DRAFT_532383 [Hymenoscyphus varicosporioides]
MFDISWTDPQRETVAQRRNRKQNHARGSSRKSSSRASGSTDSELRYKPGLLTLFDSNNKKFNTDEASLRSESTSSQSIYSRTVTTAATSSTFPLTPDSIIHGPSTSTSLTFSFDHGASNSPIKSPYHTSTESETSPTNTAGLDLSAWTGSSTSTESTDSFTDDSPTSKWFLIQPLSPRSYVSQTTEITSSPRASIGESESLSAVSVRIFAETYEDSEEDAPTRRPSIFDIPLQDPDALSTRSRDKDHLPSKIQPTLSPIKSRENIWSPPQDWNCSQEKLPTESPKSSLESPLSRSLSNPSENSELEFTHIRPKLLRVDSGHSQEAFEDSQQIWADDISESRHYELAVRNRQ